MDIKSKEMTLWNKKQRRNNKIKLFLMLFVSLILLLNSYFISAIIFLIIMYILNDVLWSDHLFYDPKQDYSYNFNTDFSESIELNSQQTNKQQILWKETYNNKTLFLEIELQGLMTGWVFDPYIEITSGTAKQKQFFERGLNGKRFINLSHIEVQSESVSLNCYHCKINNQTASLHGFEPVDLDNKKILIIAPHADDAEIAAFGLYSNNNCFIATITAGEVEAEYYEDGHLSPSEASQLKGRLRAWDSLAVPQWAGVEADQLIQLGYFCLTLEQMKLNPEQSVSSLTANVSDPRFFRRLNCSQSKVILNDSLLNEKEQQKASWPRLINDLSEIIKTVQPDIICTPHPLIDPHKDHFYSTLACWEACSEACDPLGTPVKYLLYANHNNHTDLSPFGLSGSLVSVAPEFISLKSPVSLMSYPLDDKMQYEKRSALGMMHDLNTPISFKKKLRQKLQSFFIGRESFHFGHDDYFRKAVRQNELFYQVDQEQLKQLIAEK